MDTPFKFSVEIFSEYPTFVPMEKNLLSALAISILYFDLHL